MISIYQFLQTEGTTFPFLSQYYTMESSPQKNRIGCEIRANTVRVGCTVVVRITVVVHIGEVRRRNHI